MLRQIGLLLCTIILSLLATQPALSRPQQDSLNVIPVPSSNSASLYQDDDGWTTLTIGQSIYGIRYADPGAVIVNDNLVMSCVPDPQSVTGTGLYVSQPSRLKKFVLVLCSQYSGDQAYVINTAHGRSVSRDAVPKHWSIIKWIGWSPDERFALVAAGGEATMGDMAFVDLRTREMREIHFKDLTNNPRTDRANQLQDFDPDAIVWSTASIFQVRLEVRCNPYELGDRACDYKRILSRHLAQVNLKPFTLSYGPTSPSRNTVTAASSLKRATTRPPAKRRGANDTEESIDFSKFSGAWEYAKDSPGKYYFKLAEVLSRRFHFMEGFEYEGRISWAETMVNNADGVYLRPLNGRLEGKFVSPNFRATHGHDIVYTVRLSLQHDGKLLYSVISELGTERYYATRISN